MLSAIAEFFTMIFQGFIESLKYITSIVTGLLFSDCKVSSCPPFKKIIISYLCIIGIVLALFVLFKFVRKYNNTKSASSNAAGNSNKAIEWIIKGLGCIGVNKFYDVMKNFLIKHTARWLDGEFGTWFKAQVYKLFAYVKNIFAPVKEGEKPKKSTIFFKIFLTVISIAILFSILSAFEFFSLIFDDENKDLSFLNCIFKSFTNIFDAIIILLNTLFISPAVSFADCTLGALDSTPKAFSGTK